MGGGGAATEPKTTQARSVSRLNRASQRWVDLPARRRVRLALSGAASLNLHPLERSQAVLAQHVAAPGVHPVLLPPPREAGVEGERQPARFMAPVLE